MFKYAILFYLNSFLIFAVELPAPRGNIDYSKCAKFWDNFNFASMSANGSMSISDTWNYNKVENVETLEWSSRKFQRMGGDTVSMEVKIERDGRGHIAKVGHQTIYTAGTGRITTRAKTFDFSIRNGQCVVDRVRFPDIRQKEGNGGEFYQAQVNYAYTPLCREIHSFFEQNPDMKNCGSIRLNKQLLGILDNHIQEGEHWVHHQEQRVQGAKREYEKDPNNIVHYAALHHPATIASETLAACRFETLGPFYTDDKIWETPTPNNTQSTNPGSGQPVLDSKN